MPIAFRIAALIGVTLLAACATTQPLTVEEKQSLYAPFSQDPFVPVNVFINAGDLVPMQHANNLRYLADQLRTSKAFVRTDFGMQRWEYSLDLRYNITQPTDAANLAGAVLFGGSLGVIPAKFSEQHVLSVEVLRGVEIVEKLEYSEIFDRRVSLYDMGDPWKAHRAGVDRLLAKMLTDLGSKGLIPRAAVLPPATPKPLEQSL